MPRTLGIEGLGGDGVVEAQRVEASGRHVRYLNIGDPVAFGFNTPPHLIAAVERALHDGHNGYGPSPGLASGREAVAAEYTSRGFPVTPDRTFLTAGTSEGIELALGALVDEGANVLVPLPTYPLYTAVIAKRFSARVVLLHSLPMPHYAVGMEMLGEAFADRNVDASQQLEAFEKAELAGVPTERLLVGGDPALGITDLARREPQQIIVMPTHGHSKVVSLLLGSTTTKVLHDAPCPILTSRSTRSPCVSR